MRSLQINLCHAWGLFKVERRAYEIRSEAMTGLTVSVPLHRIETISKFNGKFSNKVNYGRTFCRALLFSAEQSTIKAPFITFSDFLRRYIIHGPHVYCSGFVFPAQFIALAKEFPSLPTSSRMEIFQNFMLDKIFLAVWIRILIKFLVFPHINILIYVSMLLVATC